MVKRKIIICLSSCIILVIGIAIGFVVNNIAIHKSIEENTVQTSFSDSILNDYKGIFTTDSSRLKKDLNSNPIDEKYYIEYQNVSTPDDEINVMNEWINAYENEYNNAYQCIIDVLEEKSSSSAIELKESLEIFNKQYLNSSAISKLTFSAEEYVFGHGSAHVYDGIFNELNYKREYTLMMIETVMLVCNEYHWLGETDQG